MSQQKTSTRHRFCLVKTWQCEPGGFPDYANDILFELLLLSINYMSVGRTIPQACRKKKGYLNFFMFKIPPKSVCLYLPIKRICSFLRRMKKLKIDLNLALIRINGSFSWDIWGNIQFLSSYKMRGAIGGPNQFCRTIISFQNKPTNFTSDRKKHFFYV